MRMWVHDAAHVHAGVHAVEKQVVRVFAREPGTILPPQVAVEVEREKGRRRRRRRREEKRREEKREKRREREKKDSGGPP